MDSDKQLAAENLAAATRLMAKAIEQAEKAGIEVIARASAPTSALDAVDDLSHLDDVAVTPPVRTVAEMHDLANAVNAEVLAGDLSALVSSVRGLFASIFPV